MEKIEIRKMRACDADAVFGMMRVFYDSPAVLHKVSDAVLRRDIAACVEDGPYLEGYVFLSEGRPVGYSMIAKSFSTEYGGPCIWIEDLYIVPEYHGRGISSAFFSALEKEFAGKAVRYRLEVEEENGHAMRIYSKRGYRATPYVVMGKEL